MHNQNNTPMAPAQPPTSLLIDIAAGNGSLRGVTRMDLLMEHRTTLLIEAAALKRRAQMERYWSKIKAIEAVQRLIDEERDMQAIVAAKGGTL